MGSVTKLHKLGAPHPPTPPFLHFLVTTTQEITHTRHGTSSIFWTPPQSHKGILRYYSLWRHPLKLVSAPALNRMPVSYGKETFLATKEAMVSLHRRHSRLRIRRNHRRYATLQKLHLPAMIPPEQKGPRLTLIFIAETISHGFP